MQIEENKVNYNKNFKKLKNKGDVQVKDNKHNDAIKIIAKNEGYIHFTAEAKIIDANGGNFLGELYLIEIKGDTSEGTKETNIFVKQALSDCNINYVNIEKIFAKEIFVYTELSKLFNDLQDEANVPKKERFEIVKCYHTVEGQAIFMENMIKKGYIIPNRMEPINLDYAESCIKTLARFHGLSFALQRKNEDYFEKNIKGLQYAFALEKEWENFCVESFERAITVLENKEEQNKFSKLLPRVRNNFKDYFLNKDYARTICHGDYRSNNILAKQTDTGDIKTITLDYQHLNYGNPVNDFMYFIFGATDRDFRKNHLNNLKELYYTTLTDFLKYFKLKISDIYPRDVFEKDYESRFEFGLMINAVVLQFILAPEDNFPDFNDKAAEVEFILTDQYKDRMRGLFQDYVEWGFI